MRAYEYQRREKLGQTAKVIDVAGPWLLPAVR